MFWTLLIVNLILFAAIGVHVASDDLPPAISFVCLAIFAIFGQGLRNGGPRSTHTLFSIALGLVIDLAILEVLHPTLVRWVRSQWGKMITHVRRSKGR
jgi:hypothetical protein